MWHARHRPYSVQKTAAAADRGPCSLGVLSAAGRGLRVGSQARAARAGPYGGAVAGSGSRLPAAPERDPEYGHDALVVCDSLVRIYQAEGIEVQALQGLDLLVHDGEMIAIVDASGSGKSTLLHVLAGVDAPTAGRARVAGHVLLDLTRGERVRYRRDVVGFVRQQTARNLVPYLTATQVIDLP